MILYFTDILHLTITGYKNILKSKGLFFVTPSKNNI
jgi:hypothetical protein